MATIFVYNSADGEVERYTRGVHEPMPYNNGRTLTVGEFTAGSRIETVWTDTDTMIAFNLLRLLYNRPIHIVKGFVDPAEADASSRPQHLFGTAFILRPVKGSGSVRELCDAALKTDAFVGMERIGSDRDSLYLDARYRPSRYFMSAGLPSLSRGSRGNHVLTLQRCLDVFGFGPIALDGIFGCETECAVKRMQRLVLLTPDGIVGEIEWKCILNHACF